jgi:2-succinyl-6-hydroxy-2,4-cyclohexadiene-1-carboxylate synthase
METLKIHRNVAKSNGIDIFYLDTRADGPAILCLHGHGLSGKPLSKYTAEEMAADMIELLEYLKLDSVIVVGHSMGGRVAGYMAALYPQSVRALAILDKSASGPTKPNLLTLDKIAAIDPITKDWPLPFASQAEAKEFIREKMDSELSYQYFMNSLVETVEGCQMMFSSQANIAYEQSWFHLLPKIKCPVMLIRAKDGEAVSDEDLLKMKSLPTDCVSHDMSQSDHNVHLSNKAEFYGYFDELLKRTADMHESKNRE